MDLEEAQDAYAVRWADSSKLFKTLPGATELIATYGGVPGFHDGEVEAVHLTKKGPSKISIMIPMGLETVVVTLTAEQVLDVALEGFSPQNVIQELWFSVPEPNTDYSASDGDVKVELEPIWGLGGTIIMRNVELSWTVLPPIIDPADTAFY